MQHIYYIRTSNHVAIRITHPHYQPNINNIEEENHEMCQQFFFNFELFIRFSFNENLRIGFTLKLRELTKAISYFRFN